jgi:hypothetical protein
MCFCLPNVVLEMPRLDPFHRASHCHPPSHHKFNQSKQDEEGVNDQKSIAPYFFTPSPVSNRHIIVPPRQSTAIIIPLITLGFGLGKITSAKTEAPAVRPGLDARQRDLLEKVGVVVRGDNPSFSLKFPS